jgi:hypothetical protein
LRGLELGDERRVRLAITLILEIYVLLFGMGELSVKRARWWLCTDGPTAHFSYYYDGFLPSTFSLSRLIPLYPLRSAFLHCEVLEEHAFVACPVYIYPALRLHFSANIFLCFCILLGGLYTRNAVMMG